MNCKNAKKYYTVYRTKNLINQREYIGFHSTDDLDDGYLGSGKLIRAAIEKHGPENFVKEYIAIFDNKEDAEDLERMIVNKDYVLSNENYNLSVGGNICILHGEKNGFYGKKHSEETIKRIREKSSRLIHSEEMRKQISESMKKRWRDPEYIEKHSASMKRFWENASDEYRKNFGENCSKALTGRIFTEEHKNNISFSRKWKFANDPEFHKRYKESCRSPERRAKISKALTGKKRDPEVVNKINRNPEKIRKTAEKHRGMKRSEESKKRMSDAAKRRGANNKDIVRIRSFETNEKKIIKKDEDIPKGWVKTTLDISNIKDQYEDYLANGLQFVIDKYSLKAAGKLILKQYENFINKGV